MAHWLEKVITLLQADTSDLRELARMAGGNPKTFYRGVRLRDLDLDGQNIEDMEFSPPETEEYPIGIFVPSGDKSFLIAIEDIIKAIRKVGRQEERLALLLRLILENRKFGVEILKTYGRDKAKFASRVTTELSAALASENDQMSLFENHPVKRYGDDALALILYRPFSRGMPSNRSALLYYMTAHLAQFSKIKRVSRI